MTSLLKKLYYDPETGFISAKKLYQKAKQRDPSITLKQVREWYATQQDIQQFKHQKPTYPQFKIASYNPDSWQIDLVFFKGKTILTGININSRIGYAKLLPNKQAETVLKAIKAFEKQHKVRILTSDNGREFLNRSVQGYLKEENIEHYNNEVGDHHTMGKIERFNRTLKQRLTKINKVPTQKLLNQVIRNYNNTEHSTIKATPNEMKGEIIDSELRHNDFTMKKVSDAFEIGSSVMYRLKPKTFQKEGVKWSKTIYQVDGVDGYKIKIRSKNNHVLYKSANDLKLVASQPTDAPLDDNEVWEVEKILSHKKMRNGKYKYLIKWQGYDDPTWEIQDNLRPINKNQMSELEKNYFHN